MVTCRFRQEIRNLTNLCCQFQKLHCQIKTHVANICTVYNKYYHVRYFLKQIQRQSVPHLLQIAHCYICLHVEYQMEIRPSYLFVPFINVTGFLLYVHLNCLILVQIFFFFFSGANLICPRLVYNQPLKYTYCTIINHIVNYTESVIHH